MADYVHGNNAQNASQSHRNGAVILSQKDAGSDQSLLSLRLM